MVSHVRLNRLKRKKEILRQRQREQEEKFRQMCRNARVEERNLAKEIEAEQYAVLVKQLKSTGFPIHNVSLLVGMALKAKQILDGDEEQKTRTINEYTRLYQDFVEKQRQQEAARAAAPAESQADYPGTYPPYPGEVTE